MDKGLLVIGAIGVAIIYFATNFSGDKPADNDISWSVSDKNDKLSPYYEEDVLGNRVLNLSKVSLDQAKSIWPSTPTAQEISSIVPDFDLARIEIENSVVEGEFRQYLFQSLEEIEGRFQSGKIQSNQAKKAILNLR